MTFTNDTRNIGTLTADTRSANASFSVDSRTVPNVNTWALETLTWATEIHTWAQLAVSITLDNRN